MTREELHKDFPKGTRIGQRYSNEFADYVYDGQQWLLEEVYKEKQAADNYTRRRNTTVHKADKSKKAKVIHQPKVDPYIPGKVYVRPGVQGNKIQLMYHGNGRWSRVQGKVAPRRVEILVNNKPFKTLFI